MVKTNCTLQTLSSIYIYTNKKILARLKLTKMWMKWIGNINSSSWFSFHFYLPQENQDYDPTLLIILIILLFYS